MRKLENIATADRDIRPFAVVGLADFKRHLMVGIDERNNVQLQKYILVGDA